MVEIGNIKIKNKVVLAPMAGINDSAFRRIIKEMGGALIYTEMISDKGLIFNNLKTNNMLYFTEAERPISAQIFGNDKQTMSEAAKIVAAKMHPDIIDINMGCPVPKVALKSQAGAAILKDPQKVYDIVSSVVESVKIPVSVKIRSGWDNTSINAVEVAQAIERAGAKLIAVHGRTRNQAYQGHVNLDIIKLVKENVHIPVIGNGDIVDIKSAKDMLDYTKCDLIMIGRGVLGNPWLVKQINVYLETGKVIAPPTIKERVTMCLKHFDYLLEEKEETLAVLEMRKHVAWYLKSCPNTSELKKQVFQVKTAENLKKLLKNYLKKQLNVIK